MTLCRHPDLPPDQLANLIHPEGHAGWMPVESGPDQLANLIHPEPAPEQPSDAQPRTKKG